MSHEVIDDSQLIRWAYDNIKQTGLFDRDCEKWRKKPQADKDWTSFQQFFLEADEDRKKNSTIASEATYTANQVQELLQNEINNILQSTDTPTITSPPSPTASANASVTADDATLSIVMPLLLSSQKFMKNSLSMTFSALLSPSWMTAFFMSCLPEANSRDERVVCEMKFEAKKIKKIPQQITSI